MTSTGLDIQTLTLRDLERMAGVWDADLDIRQVRSVLERFPGRSLWSPAQSECIIVSEWRRRPEIASIVGVRAVRSRAALMERAAERALEMQLEAILAIEWNESLRPAFYESIGFEQLDAVIPFELTNSGSRTAKLPDNRIERIDILDDRLLDQLIELDHAAFSWLWSNSRAEFEHYGVSDDVELWGHVLDGTLVSYAGITAYGHWGHIDRLAVHPEMQRRGLGNELTRFAIERLRANGAKTIGLSTQASNWKSQRLYANLGFRRSSQNTYRIYGRIFDKR